MLDPNWLILIVMQHIRSPTLVALFKSDVDDVRASLMGNAV